MKISKTCQYLSLVGGFNFRLGTCNVPEGPSANPYAEARRVEFNGTDGMDGTESKVSFNVYFWFLHVARFKVSGS